MVRFVSAALAGAVLALAAVPAGAQSIEERAQQCAACHGDNGVPNDPLVPVIWGQHEGYIYIQLRDYKNKLRKNEFMNQLTADMSKDDMMAFASYYAAKTWPDTKQPRAPKDVAAKAEELNTSAQCTQCHLDGYLGDGVQPRLAGQTYDYLKRTMLDFRTKERANNPWMSDLLNTYTEADVDILAKYLSGL